MLRESSREKIRLTVSISTVEACRIINSEHLYIKFHEGRGQVGLVHCSAPKPNTWQDHSSH